MVTPRSRIIVSIVIAVLLLSATAIAITTHRYTDRVADRGGEVIVRNGYIELPLPRPISGVYIEETILRRRSIREYRSEPLDIEQLSLILWAAQGITDTRYLFRASPSAGATYPLEIYVVVGNCGVSTGNGFLEAGVYKYDVRKHALVLVKRGDVRDVLASAALDQEWVRSAPVDIVICAVYERTMRIYGERGYRYVHIEVGHAGQNIYLMATALRLGTVAVGAFYDEKVAEVIGARRDEHPLYIMPIGVPAWFPTTTFEDIHELYTRFRGSGS